ncbi:MAG: hypothetical protein ABSF08_00895 [Candidatus Cybelea sp.]
MKSVLFVSNGHGEAAIADRIAAELHAIAPEATLDHLALVGEPISDCLEEVGPRRTMPSGGLIAMGNVRNLMQDLRAGLLPLVAAQRKFLASVRGSYAVAVAVGDVYGLAMTLRARVPTVFVGTAKSVSVARYGALEERVLRGARACFVRDEATAQALREHGLCVEPSANVIVDLFAPGDDPAVEAAVAGFATMLALFPGSRAGAYDDAGFLLAVLREIAGAKPGVGAVLSIARGLDAQRFAADAQRAGWRIGSESHDCVPFVLNLNERTVVRAWTGSPASLLKDATLVLGQAGTANEGAAAAGVPVVAFARDRASNERWYRRRQRGLLGDALVVLTGNAVDAARGVCDILDDSARRRLMSQTGRVRMGAGGAARRIADRIASLASEN